jgi:hypothetical protein
LFFTRFDAAPIGSVMQGESVSVKIAHRLLRQRAACRMPDRSAGGLIFEENAEFVGNTADLSRAARERIERGGTDGSSARTGRHFCQTAQPLENFLRVDVLVNLTPNM